MSLYTTHFIYCSKCDYKYYLQWATGPNTDPFITEWVFTGSHGELFPLMQTQCWCQECNTITKSTRIPEKTEINAYINELKENLKKYESGEWGWYGKPRGEHARRIIMNHDLWLQWQSKQPKKRCLTCGTYYLIDIDPKILSELDDKLPFAHPGCGGDLLFGTDEDGFHYNGRRRHPDDPVRYISYSFDGFPVGETLSRAQDALNEKCPGLLGYLHRAIPMIARDGFQHNQDIQLPPIISQVNRQALNQSLLKFIDRAIIDSRPDPNDKQSLQASFSEIHRLSAFLIRSIIHETTTLGTRGPVAQTDSTNELKTSIHNNPFYVIGATTRDNRRKIVELTEERALHLDHDLCQKARSDLTNPRARLAAEVAWMPGVSPRVSEKLIKELSRNPISIRSEEGLPELACANLMAAAFELVKEDEPAEGIAEFMRDFAWVVEVIDAEDVLRDINEDRGVSGFPEVKGVEAIEEELAERRKAYRAILKNLLDSMDPNKLIETMTDAVAVATNDGEDHAPALLDDLVDAYEVETQGFLQKEYDNIAKLVESAREAAPRGEKAVAPIVDKIGKVARNWDRVAQPIQLSAKSRGITHAQSREVAYELRSLGIDLNNEHGMLEQAHKMTGLLQELFAELPDVVERLGEDAEAISGLRQQAQEKEKNRAQWERDITFRAEIGVLFKDDLSISPQGVRWKENLYPLDSITRVRWGGVRHSVNGVPTGTTYTIGFGDPRSSQSIELRKESTYSGFLEALWRAVCVRLMFSIIEQLEEGRSLTFGDMVIEDSAVTMVKHKFLGANEKVRLPWSQVHVWSADGSFIIGKKDDKKTYGSSSYINNWNTHLLEHIIRGGFKKGVRKLSDYLKD